MTDYNEIEDTIIETVDENGDVVKFELLDVIELDGQEYGLLFPLYEDGEDAGGDDEEAEAIVMRLTKEDDSYVFERIDDDAEFNKVAQYIDSIREEI